MGKPGERSKLCKKIEARLGRTGVVCDKNGVFGFVKKKENSKRYLFYTATGVFYTSIFYHGNNKILRRHKKAGKDIQVGDIVLYGMNKYLIVGQSGKNWITHCLDKQGNIMASVLKRDIKKRQICYKVLREEYSITEKEKILLEKLGPHIFYEKPELQPNLANPKSI